MKREARRAVIYEGRVAVICVYRGEIIEHVFIGRNREEALRLFGESTVREEVKEFVEDPTLLEQCAVVGQAIEDKAKRNSMGRIEH
ncbi:MAG: hypothetical protein ACP5HQ_02215 [Thermoprotei archaeon]